MVNPSPREPDRSIVAFEDPLAAGICAAWPHSALRAWERRIGVGVGQTASGRPGRAGIIDYKLIRAVSLEHQSTHQYISERAMLPGSELSAQHAAIGCMPRASTLPRITQDNKHF